MHLHRDGALGCVQPDGNEVGKLFTHSIMSFNVIQLKNRARRKGQIATMVEEKARSLLPRHHFASLSYYIAEYSAKAMTIDAFVAVLLEMLDTYEKVSDMAHFKSIEIPN